VAVVSQADGLGWYTAATVVADVRRCRIRHVWSFSNHLWSTALIWMNRVGRLYREGAADDLLVALNYRCTVRRRSLC
jgi:hypothetical protein